ncbi:flagellar motor switch protein FliG [Desulfoluna spongiiphila]|uniref:Flagellar motor switch protein FliG n=1 Tax=Desulfoluna spongiiphila TaxID=419481 RepID=A0A1G5IY93_9BACT|nr:flagellar motor switch protein FliG [Desulfoluna spongiiphila]SCY80671.1 flagellar motor switch protein FliG [Desulfoluna spongiiphila]VVS93267.1 flagellar motor switch protein flig [Desulfoluna spongiiphila]
MAGGDAQKGDKPMTGPMKAAIFLLSLGEGRAAEVFKKLNDAEIRLVATTMTQIREILPEDLAAVANEFIELFEGDTKLMVESGDFLRNVIKNTLPSDRAEEILKEIEALQRDKPFGWSRDVNVSSLSTALLLEHPQTIAMIMAHLPPDIAADVLISFPEDMKGDVALRVARIGQIPEEIVRDVDGALKDELKNMVSSGGKVGGLQVLVDIIGGVDKATEDTVMEMIEEEDMEMAMNVRDMMFVFEDLVGVDDRGMREVLKRVEGAQLTVALKTASEDMKNKILGNLSSRAAEMILEDLEVMGPVKLSEVEGAQQAVVQAAKDLEAEGTITLAGKGKDDILV